VNRRDFDAAKVTRQCATFIKGVIENAKADGVVIGLSGGLDSAVVAALCVKAIGNMKVHAALLPIDTTERNSFKRARELANRLNVDTTYIPLAPHIAPFGFQDRVRHGNISARLRMIIQYDMAKAVNCLVAGTENKSEYLMGYFTLHGDGACDFSPIRDLYKTEVRWLAEYLDVPQEIRDAAPSAELWDGQTDETEMGVTYDQIDEYFYRVFNTRDKLVDIRRDIGADVVKVIEDRHKATHYKRADSPVCFINRGKLK